MIINWQGKQYSYDPGAVTVKEAVVIKAHTGHGLVSWERACRDFDPQAVQALLWLIKGRNGEPCEVALLDFDIIAFMNAYAEGVLASQQPQPEDSGKAGLPDGSTPDLTPTLPA